MVGFGPTIVPSTQWDLLWLTESTPLGSLPHGHAQNAPRGTRWQALPMNAQELLQEISDYCRHTGLAESTFGRRAVNDGKLTARLRNGGRITTDTLDRIRSFMADNRAAP